MCIHSAWAGGGVFGFLYGNRCDRCGVKSEEQSLNIWQRENIEPKEEEVTVK